MKKYSFFQPPTAIGKELVDLKTKPSVYWGKRGEKMALDLFNFTYQTVSAYRKYLKKHKFNKNRLGNINDFKELPLISKETYLRPSKYEELFPNKKLTTSTTISGTSGSTGEPFYFPRLEIHDKYYQYTSEIFLKNQFEIDKHSTLGIIGFGLGIWIGGIFTYKNFNVIASKGYKLTLAPIGANKELFLKTIKRFGKDYDQIIIMGYPPFIKDVIDDAVEFGVKLKKYQIKILTAAEGFSERFREYVVEKAGLKNPFKDIINIYGTVELGTMAHETALSYLIRHLAFHNKKLAHDLFHDAPNIPTLAQYYPHIAYFEELNNEVIGTGYCSSIPLVRYKFHDVGGVIGYEEMRSKLSDHGVNLGNEAKKAGIKNIILKTPFVYVVERSDNSLILRGANIFSSEIRHALDNRKLSRFITGKFTMLKYEDNEADEKLEINIELKKNVSKSRELIKKILDTVVIELLKNNIEYSYLYSLQPTRVLPHIVCHNYRDNKFFMSLGKQRWVSK